MTLVSSARRRLLAAALGALALISLGFLLAPRADVAVSALFYDPASGFLHQRLAIVETLREAGRLVEWAFAIAVLAPLPLKLLLPERRMLVPPRVTLFVLGVLALGPGLVVNGVLKEFWGRARPRDLVEFGGEATFSPVWWISDQCERNCSFVAGEAAGAFWLVALAFVAPKAWRPAAAAATLAFAALVSFTRIAMGGHFLSDVLIAWLLVLIIMIVLDRLILKGLPAGFDANVERALAAPMRRLRRRFALRRHPPTL